MKKIILSIAVLAIAGVVALNVNLGAKKSDEVSLLALANVEALANFEFPEGSYCDMYVVPGRASRCWQLWSTVYVPLPYCVKTGNPDHYCYSL